MPAATAQSPLKKTALCPWHAEHGGRMVDFAGWLMPVQYTSIVDEHAATRQAVGLFDVSHMGRLQLRGAGAGAFLNRLVTRNVQKIAPGQVRYALVTNHAGGILDDVLVYHLPAAEGQQSADFQLVVNASNREKILHWINEQNPAADKVTIEDRTFATAMIAVQGPRANEALAPLVSTDPGQLKYYTATTAQVCGAQSLVGRTGYTGEDGWELIVPAERSVEIWQALLDRGVGAVAAGLGCRDTLRLEAAMPLYGHELSETIDPYTAGLGFAVDLEGRTFPGRDALAELRDAPNLRRRVGLQLAGKRVPREHYAVIQHAAPVGEVSSGTFSPTLGCPIAMAYVQPQAAAIGESLLVDIRGRQEPARVVALPFYKRPKSPPAAVSTK